MIGQQITSEQPQYAEVTTWCNENNAVLVRIDDDLFEVQQANVNIPQDELNKIKISKLKDEAQNLIPHIQAGIDVDANQRRLINIMLEIEELQGNI